jgi:hypothetical protein
MTDQINQSLPKSYLMIEGDTFASKFKEVVFLLCIRKESRV